MSNSDDKIVSQQKFYGGQSSDAAIGTDASFSYGQALEFRRNPSQLSVLPGARKISAGVVQDLILNMAQVQNGTRYAYGDQGNIYKIDTSNVVTYLNKLPTGSDGMLYRQDSDALYFATSTDLRRYYPISGTPTFDQTYGVSKSTDTAATRTGGTLTYTVPVTLNENDFCSFVPDIEPFYSIKNKIVSKGTGNLVLTLHDGLNNILATVTTTNANFNVGMVEQVFSSQIRALVKPNGRTYHFHLTSTVADTTVACSTAGSLQTADYELWAYRFVDTVNNFHPVAQFQQFICIGNERYLSVWEPITDSNPANNEFQRHKLTFPPGYEVCGLCVTDEFLVIACEKRSTDGTKDFQEGKLFTWDGTSPNPTQIVDVSGGSPEGIFTYENYPYFFVDGALCAWPGGKNIIKVRTIANTSTAYRDAIENTQVYPNMMTIKDNLLHLGFPSSTTNVAIEHGVYTWGSLEKNYPASFGYSYLISTQTNLNTAGTLQLGCVRNFGDEMYLSWKDGTSYGLDIVDSNCDPASVYKFRARRFDAGSVRKDKKALKMAIDADALPTGTIITPVFSINGAADVPNATMVAGDTEKIVAIPPTNMKFKRITYGFDGTCSGTISPVIYASTLLWNPLIDSKAL